MARSFDNLYIGGSWIQTSGSFDDMNPSDGSVWARVADGDASMAAHATWNVLAPIVTNLFTATILLPLAQVFPQLTSLISQSVVVTAYFAAKVAAPALAKMGA